VAERGRVVVDGGDRAALRWLVLDSTGVSDHGLQHLQHLRSLPVLSLNGTVVSDEGLRFLEGLVELEELEVMART
jgi:hypothetical protein